MQFKRLEVGGIKNESSRFLESLMIKTKQLKLDDCLFSDEHQRKSAGNRSFEVEKLELEDCTIDLACANISR